MQLLHTISSMNCFPCSHWQGFTIFFFFFFCRKLLMAPLGYNDTGLRNIHQVNWSRPNQVHCNSEYINLSVYSFTQPLFMAINRTRHCTRYWGIKTEEKNLPVLKMNVLHSQLFLCNRYIWDFQAESIETLRILLNTALQDTTTNHLKLT